MLQDVSTSSINVTTVHNSVLTLVPTPIGNLEDISFRALRVLFEASTILCEDTRVTHKLLDLLKTRHSIPDPKPHCISLHSHNEHAFMQTLTQEFFHQNVVYVSDAGMPGISDPGQMLVDYCLTHGINYEILPGASASIVAFVASGFIKTQFLFGGFLPHKGADRSRELEKLLFSGYTVVLYESPHRLSKLLEELSLRTPKRRIFLAKELSKKFETKLRATAQELHARIEETNIKGEWIVVIEADVPPPQVTFSQEMLLNLKLPIKEKSKLLAQLGEHSAKTWYERLSNSHTQDTY